MSADQPPLIRALEDARTALLVAGSHNEPLLALLNAEIAATRQRFAEAQAEAKPEAAK